MTVDPFIVETWLTGWCLSRELALPVKAGAGFWAAVGWPQQKARYVFPHLADELVQLASTINEPWVFLKICAHPNNLIGVLPSHWIVQPHRFMMVCPGPMSIKSIELDAGYTLNVKDNLPVPTVEIHTSDGEMAANGYIVFVNGYAIYDRIETHPDHRRKGLATMVLKSLEAIAASRGITKGILVATPEGKALYETLGWQLYSHYTTVVIPGD